LKFSTITILKIYDYGWGYEAQNHTHTYPTQKENEAIFTEMIIPIYVVVKHTHKKTSPVLNSNSEIVD
jgi:hypothetical protein